MGAVTVTTEFTTAKGRTVRVGDRYRDNRSTNIRTLRVDRIEVDEYGPIVHCVVIHQDHGDGRVTEPMRKTEMTAERLTSRSFALVGGGR